MEVARLIVCGIGVLVLAAAIVARNAKAPMERERDRD